MNSIKFSREKEIELFVLCIWLFLIRIAIPYAKYFFVPYFVFFISYTIFRRLKTHDIKELTSYYLRVFFSFLLICIFFITGVFLSSKLDFYFLKEGLAMFVLIGIGIMAFTFLENEDDFRFFTRIFMKQLLAFCIFISIFSLVKLFFLLRGVRLDLLSDAGGVYPRGSSLVIDYNFYALVNILGIITASFLLVKERSTIRSVLLQLLVFGLILNVIFSTSRRGIVVLAVLLLFYFLILLFGWLAGKGRWMNILSRKLRLVFVFFTGFIFLMVIFLSQKPFHSPSSRYIDTGFDRITGMDLLHECVVRYKTIIDPKFSHETMNSRDSLALQTPKENHQDAYFTGILSDPGNRFSGGRLQRVNFGIRLFSEKYSTSKKIIGGGFDYLWDFGHEFYHRNHDRFYFDYPHNPILSAFLYSGILGGLSLIYFFCMTFLNFIREYKSLLYFICLYVIIFFFAFFSGNSIFGNPEFVFVSLVPFYFNIVRYRGRQKSLTFHNRNSPAS